MKFTIPENRKALIPEQAASKAYIDCFPWAIEADHEEHWAWGDVLFDDCISGSTRREDLTWYTHELDKEFIDQHDIHIDQTKAELPLAMAADAVLQYVLENPHYYGLKKIESEEEQS